jgi:DNA polymerase-1
MPVKRRTIINSFDVETTGFRPYNGDRIFAYCIGDEEGKVKVKRVEKHPDNELQQFLNRISIEKVCHNLKFELGMLVAHNYKIPCNTTWHDTMIMSQLLDNLRPEHSLDYVAWILSGWSRDLDKEIKRLGRAFGGYQNIPRKKMEKYQIADGQRTMLLYYTWFPEIYKNPQLYTDYRNEIELIKVTQRMEQRGVVYAEKESKELLKIVEHEIEKAEIDLIDAVDDYYNLASPKQVSALLYGKLKLPILQRTSSGSPSVDKDTLSLLQEQTDHPIFDVLKRHRSYTKGRGIIKGYSQLTDANGIIHPNLKTNHAATGREACDTPNLQNVAKETKKDNPYTIAARRCFRAHEGFALMPVDQSGIELRLIIEAAGCKRMRQHLEKREHPHEVFAEMMFGNRYKGKRKTSDLYDVSKNAHFALCYGASLQKIADTLKISIYEAEPGYKKYCNQYPEIANLVSSGIDICKRNDGIVTTPFGRKLQIPYDKLYSWLNYYIQGTAAGIIKRGQVNIQKIIDNKSWKNLVYIVLTVHDEIIFEVHESVVNTKYLFNDLLHEIRNAMIAIPEINVPLEVEFSLAKNGKTWAEAEEI